MPDPLAVHLRRSRSRDRAETNLALETFDRNVGLHANSSPIASFSNQLCVSVHKMSQEEKAGASKTYKDVSPLTSDSESDTDPAVQRARNSTEVAGQDRDILHEEEERENLLYGKHGHSGKKEYTDQGFVGNAKRKAKQFKKKRYGSVGNDENGELMYEMEEGGPHSDISSQASMSSVELDKLNLSHHRQSRVSSMPR